MYSVCSSPTTPDRETLAGYIKENAANGDIAVVMGARDNSLGDFAVELAKL